MSHRAPRTYWVLPASHFCILLDWIRWFPACFVWFPCLTSSTSDISSERKFLVEDSSRYLVHAHSARWYETCVFILPRLFSILMVLMIRERRWRRSTGSSLSALALGVEKSRFHNKDTTVWSFFTSTTVPRPLNLCALDWLFFLEKMYFAKAISKSQDPSLLRLLQRRNRLPLQQFQKLMGAEHLAVIFDICCQDGCLVTHFYWPLLRLLVMMRKGMLLMVVMMMTTQQHCNTDAGGDNYW